MNAYNMKYFIKRIRVLGIPTIIKYNNDIVDLQIIQCLLMDNKEKQYDIEYRYYIGNIFRLGIRSSE